MANDFTTLESIFRMVTPSDLLGAQKLGLGNPLDQQNVVRKLLRLLFDTGAGGAHPAPDLLSELNNYIKITPGNEEAKKNFHKILNVYSTAGKIDGVKYPYMYNDGKVVKQDDVTVKQIIGSSVSDELLKNKNVSFIVCRSPYISPAVRNADRCEIFLNSMPSIVLGRMSPYLELEFAFDRAIDKDFPLQAASLMKFLIGSPSIAKGSPDDVMIDARRSVKDDRSLSSAGMELFTSPQTLINMNPVTSGQNASSRYVDVIDPTRPFASLESVNINVTPTVGLYSYKKASAVIKLHDRSRLSEIADLIQPTTYTNTTVWLTYGWRHPDEPHNPYAKFINENMLIREAYGVKNVEFSFDNLGQVSITLELYTKSVSELRDMRVPDDEDSFQVQNKRIKDIVKEIQLIRKARNLDSPTGLNKEIRGYVILDAAERGEEPSLTPEETEKAIKELEETLKGTGKVPKGGQDPLITKLKELYKVTGAGKDKVFDFKDKQKKTATAAAQRKFNELSKGADPFLMFDAKYDMYKQETGVTAQHRYIEVYKDYEKADTFDAKSSEFFQKKIVSFGKLFAVFMSRALLAISNIDEIQIYFYTLNDKAGKAASTNIAEFPIDLRIFLNQYKEHIERRATERITVEEFIKLAVDAQISDPRAIPYGFSAQGLFKPYSQKEPAPETKNEKANGEYGKALANFAMPVIDVYVESTFAANKNGQLDLLQAFDGPTTNGKKTGRMDALTRVLKIHIFDKSANPYKVPELLLKGDSGADFIEIDNKDWVKAYREPTQHIISNLGLGQTVTTPTDAEGLRAVISRTSVNSNAKVKNMVSKMMPSIVYGTNASSITSANLATKHDALLTAAQLTGLNSGKPTTAQPNGGGTGGLPLKVIPAQLTLTTFGCPLLSYAQLFFVDFNTGTTIDNIYGISGLTHTIVPGKFESQLTMAFFDAYGRYESAPTVNDYLTRILEKPLDTTKKK